jgi:integrase
MATTPRDRLENEKNRIRSLPDEAYCSQEHAEALLEFGEALDSEKVRHKYHDESGNVKTLKPRSIDRYLSCLRLCIKGGLDIFNATAAEFNDHMDKLHDVDGKAKTTVQGYQAAGEAFYRYHDHLGVDPDDINHYGERSEPRHDERDMFTPEDIKALRQAVGETKTTTRNRALLELLIFTGQRIGALVTLRIGDIEFEDGNHGYIYLNEDYDKENGGLKGALNRGKKRPMFGATKYVRDWIQYHPKGGDDPDPDAWLFIGDPSHWKTDPNDHWAKVSADHVLRRIGEYADIDKPVNAHNFRHYCATVLYRDYDLDRDTIRMLLGHVRGSSALEEVYSHLFEDDYIQRAEERMGYREKEERNPFTPETCPTCGNLLGDSDKACSNCGSVFTPDAESIVIDDSDERIRESYQQAEGPEQLEQVQAADDVLSSIKDDPELKSALVDELKEDIVKELRE